MNLLDRLAQDKKISADELSKLSAVRQGLFAALECGQMSTVQYIQNTFSDCTKEECQKLGEMIEKVASLVESKAVAEHGVEGLMAAREAADLGFVKQAGGEDIMNVIKKTFGPGSRKAIGGAATAAILATLGMSLLHSAGQGLGMVANPISDLVNKTKMKREGERILTEIIEENPELKKDSKIVEHFGVLQRFAPNTVATNKPVAEAILKKMNQWGQIDPQTMKQILESEGQYLENLSGGKSRKGEFKPMQVGDLASVASASIGAS